MQTEHALIASNFSCDKSCGNPDHFNEYLRYYAISDIKTGMGVTHICCGFDDSGMPVKIIGFVTIKTSSVITDDDGTFNGKPAVEISELAVDEAWVRQGFGTMLVKYALAKIAETKTNIGVRYVVVCADEQAVEFYKKVGFDSLSSIYEIPREEWNAGCIPMYIDLSLCNEPVYSEDDEEED